jgi:hypothetical protein
MNELQVIDAIKILVKAGMSESKEYTDKQLKNIDSYLTFSDEQIAQIAQEIRDDVFGVEDVADTTN